MWQSTGTAGTVPVSRDVESGRESALGHGKKDDDREEFAMETFIVDTTPQI